ncbi:MAG TPA: type II secretion system protein [Frankiaceae bacterium]|nr:type II secretion system protein [Frankiaceae bacterium]
MDDVRTRDEGFSLVELLVVMVIIGILSGIAIPALAAQTKKAKIAALKSQLKAAALAQEERLTDGLPYAVPGPVGLAHLAEQGFVLSSGVVMTIVDDDMVAGGRGFCLRAHHETLTAADDWYYASTGPNAGRPTATACVAS